jgi:hypothetical protein
MAAGAVVVLVQVLVSGSTLSPADVTCTIRPVSKPAAQEVSLLRQDDGRWRWIARADDVLQCSADGLEPRDLVAPQREGEQTLTMIGARPVALKANGAAEADVEWREDGPDGTRLLARRHLAGNDAIVVPVALGQERLVRIYRPGLSPNTLAIGRDTATLPLPEGARGGEIYIACRRDTWMPEVIVIGADSGRVRLSEVTAGRAILAGVPAGTAAVSSQYKGGVRADRRLVRVVDGRTTELVPYPNRKNGALSITANGRLCDDTAGGELQIRSRTTAGAEYRLPVPPRCAGVFAGLDPGDSTAELRVGGRSIARGSASVEESAVTDLLLESYAVHVEGTVSSGRDRPVPGVTLTFRRTGEGVPAAPVQVSTDESGAFAIDLPRPGPYGIAVKASDYYEFEVASRSFVTGTQRLDLQVAPTSVVIKLRREDGGPLPEFVQIGVEGPVRMNSPVSGGGVTLSALPLGDYTLRASSSNPALSSERVRLSLTEEAPTATVELSLSSREGTLRLHGLAGEPVKGARLVGAGRELSPGVYDLTGVADDAIIQIQADGYLPSCWRRKGTSGEATLLPLGTQTLRVHVPESGSPYNLVLRGPGSECGLPLSLFVARLTAGEGQTVIEVPGLMPGPWQVGYGSVIREVMVPGPDVTFAKP